MKKGYMKSLAVMLVFLLIFSLTGCGKDTGNEKEKMPAATETETEATTEEAPTTEKEAEPEPEVDEDGFTIVKQNVKTADYVNVRLSPSTDGDIYQQLANDVTLERVGYNKEWSKVIIDGNTCYIFSENLIVLDDVTKEDTEEDSSSDEEPDKQTTGGEGKTVVIDAGHQATPNNDEEPVGPGSEEMKAKSSAGNIGVSTGVAEYELNLEIALCLEAELKSRGYEVKMIRTSNEVDMSNAARAEYANGINADAFIRIHTNGSTDSSASGCMTVCQTDKNPYNSDIYSDCKVLATNVLNELSKSTGAKSEGVWETDTMSGINWSKIPVTIVEVGYMTNPDEEKQLVSNDYQSKIAKGIANGIDKYFESK